MSEQRILVTGAAGMLGHALLRDFSGRPGLRVVGALRGDHPPAGFPAETDTILVPGVDITDIDRMSALFEHHRPTVVINAAGLVKQRADGRDPEQARRVNGQAPHQLARLCATGQCRFIHISTDCVFSGDKGDYRESDRPDATDVYGCSKLEGEVTQGNALTLRTSIIGPELERHTSLLDWFLAQSGAVPGYRRAVFSGLTTVELARVLREYILPMASLRGLYHVSAAPITKYDLLSLIQRIYDTGARLVPDDRVALDRSLNSERFRLATGYRPPDWPTLIHQMKAFQDCPPCSRS